MRVIITEDIVRNALNESLEEFMLEEGAWDGLKNWYNTNPFMQKTRSGISNAWKNIKNAAAMFMDKETGGAWNRKYNIHAQGNGYAVGTYYLGKWFETRYKRLQDIVYGDYYGNKTYFYTKLRNRDYSFTHDWKNNVYTLDDRNDSGNIYTLKLNRNGIPNQLEVKDYRGNLVDEGALNTYRGNTYSFKCKNNPMNNLTIYTGEDSSTPESYIAKECSPESFERETQYTIGNSKLKEPVKNYLRGIQKTNEKNIQDIQNDPNYAKEINYSEIISKFTTKEFYRWLGQNYDSQQNQQQQSQQQTTQQGQQQTAQTTQGQYDDTYWEHLTPPPDNGQENNYQGGYENPFRNDLGHEAPGSNNAQQQPTPNAGGRFNYKDNSLSPVIKGPYAGWKMSKDANGRRILVNPKDPTKAVFY